jgi:hypothetical protein
LIRCIWFLTAVGLPYVFLVLVLITSITSPIFSSDL